MNKKNTIIWSESDFKSLLKLFSIFAALFLLSIAVHAGTYSTLVNGNFSTNANAVYNAAASATNSSGVLTNNFQIGVVPGASNIVWQLSAVNGSQPYLGTNAALPTAVFNAENGYPGTLYGPVNTVLFGAYGTLMATNATSTAIVLNFAGSIDGNLWQTNVATITMTVPINSFAPTNFITTSLSSGGWYWLALQNVNNPGVAALTNLVVEANGKPGL